MFAQIRILTPSLRHRSLSSLTRCLRARSSSIKASFFDCISLFPFLILLSDLLVGKVDVIILVGFYENSNHYLVDGFLFLFGIQKESTVVL